MVHLSLETFEFKVFFYIKKIPPDDQRQERFKLILIFQF